MFTNDLNNPALCHQASYTPSDFLHFFSMQIMALLSTVVFAIVIGLAATSSLRSRESVSNRLIPSNPPRSRTSNPPRSRTSTPPRSRTFTQIKPRLNPLEACTIPAAGSACTPQKHANIFAECGLYRPGEACAPFCSYLLSKALRCGYPTTTFEEYRGLFIKCNFDCEQEKKKKWKIGLTKIFVTYGQEKRHINCVICVGCDKWYCHPDCYIRC